ncbi:MAG: murein biosynthesis integral membrane protein MurJ, partial [Actinobacteria bacterium]|nr:murein biosynthesis integral membrane protein MurJ [Actinomycetota bacterium]
MREAPPGASGGPTLPSGPASAARRDSLAGGIAGAATILLITILASRLLGFVRQIAITSQFGVGPEADAWFTAFRIPDTIFQLFAGGALLSAVIPVYAAVRARGDRRALGELVSGVITLVGLVTAVAGAVGAVFAEPLMRAVAPGFPPATLALAADASRWLMLSPVLLGFSAIIKAVLQAERRFWLPALSPILYNAGIIAGAVLLARWFGLSGLVWGTLLGAGLHVLVQAPGLRALRFAPRPAWAWRSPDVRRVVALVIPRIVGVAVLQISLVYVNLLASLQGESAVAALGNAFILLLLPLGMFAMSLGEAALPELSERWAAQDRAGFAQRLAGLSRHVLFLNLPASVALIMLAEPIVTVLFERGAFDARATALTATALQFFAIGLAGHALVEVLVRGFFAMHDTRTPVAVGVASLLVHMLLSWLLAQRIGQGGIALGVSIGVLLEAYLLTVLLRVRGALAIGGREIRSAATTGMATVL